MKYFLLVTFLFLEIQMGIAQELTSVKSISFIQTQSVNNLRLLKKEIYQLSDNTIIPFRRDYQFGILLAEHQSNQYKSISIASFFGQRKSIKELLVLESNPENRRYSITEMDIHVRIARGRSITFSPINNSKATLGISVDPRYLYYSALPFHQVNYPYRGHSFELSLNLIHQLEIAVTDNIMLTIIIPVQFFNSGISFLKTKNPNLPLTEQTRFITDYSLLNMIPSLNFGIGYRLSY